jgi:hypothetical protein
MRRLAPPLVACTVSAAWFAISVPARGQTAEESARAEKLFTEAMALVDKQDFASACPKLEESQRLDPALGTEFNLALCDEKIGKLAAAWRHQSSVVKLAHATGKKGREDAARERLAALAPHVPHLVVATSQPGVVVKVDGEIVDSEAFAFYAVDAGPHTVEASAPGKQPWSQSVAVPDTPADGAGPAVPVQVPLLVALAAKTVTVEKETTNVKRIAAWAIGGLGLAGIATAGVTGVLILNAKSTAQSDCTPVCATQSGRDAVSTGKTLLPINTVAWIVGGVGLGAGVTLFFLSKPTSPSRPQTGLTLVPTVGPDAGGLSVAGRF